MSDILTILEKQGSFALPYVNMFLEKLKAKKDSNSLALFYFLRGLKRRWNLERKKAMADFERSIDLAKSKTIKYIAMAELMNIHRAMKHYQRAKKIYDFLRKNYENVPEKARKLVFSFLINFCLRTESAENCFGKFRSSLYLTDPLSIYYHTALGRQLISRGDTRDGLKHILMACKIARREKRIHSIIFSYNLLAWYLKNYHPLISLRLVREALYTVGQCYENLERFYYVFDTMFNVQKITKDREALLTAMNILDTTKNSRLVEEAKVFIPSEKEYRVDRKTRRFIEKNFRPFYKTSKMYGVSRTELYLVTKGNRKRIKGETIGKLLRGLEWSPDLPEPFLKEFSRKMLEEASKSAEVTKEKFFVVYSSMLKRYRIKGAWATKLFNLNPEELKRRLSKFPEGLRFLSRISNFESSVEKARKELVEKFLRMMRKDERERFMERYFQVDERIRSLMDVYIRNRIRYRSHRTAIYCFERAKERELVRQFLYESIMREV